ncbi:hypothetical protein J3E74DRAFT_356014 [Bipolaris maydis]|nr:hypothetical protein J3E74DRAFT_356014 [Bipolaris maydis]
MVALCREKDWVLDLQPEMVESHAFEEAVTQTGKTPVRPSNYSSYVPDSAVSQSLTPSPCKKRKALDDLTAAPGAINARSSKRQVGSKSPEAKKVPAKIFTAGKRGILDGRPVLRDIYNDAM